MQNRDRDLDRPTLRRVPIPAGRKRLPPRWWTLSPACDAARARRMSATARRSATHARPGRRGAETGATICNLGMGQCARRPRLPVAAIELKAIDHERTDKGDG